MSKTIGETYLFKSYPKYSEKLFKAMMSYTRIDKKSQEFEDIVEDVSKRRTTNNMVKVMMSDKIVLLVEGEPLDKSLKIFAGRDQKSSSKDLKVFIDCCNIIEKDDDTGRYVCSNIEIFLAYLVDAMTMLGYYLSEKSYVDNASLSRSGALCFANIMTYIIDYIYKINSMSGIRYNVMYLSALYYQANILEKAFDDPGVQKIAREIASIGDSQANVLMMDVGDDDFINIKTFVNMVSKVLSLPKLTIDAVVAKWLHVFGTGTGFAMELFPAFSAMMCDACSNAYINNKNTIEKVVGAGPLAEFSKRLIQIGERL